MYFEQLLNKTRLHNCYTTVIQIALVGTDVYIC